MGIEPPIEHVVLHWTLEREEFVPAIRSRMYRRLTRLRSIVTLLIVVVASFVFATFAFGDGRPTGEIPALLLLLLLVPMGAVTIVVLAWWVPLNLWRSSSAIRRPQEAVLGPDEAVFRTEDSQGTYRWSAFDRVEDGGRVYLLYLSRRVGRLELFFLIPKRAMPGSDGGAELGELLRRFVRAGSQAGG